MSQGEILVPIELAKVGWPDAAKQLKKDGFLTLLSHIDFLPDGLPPPMTMEREHASRHSDPIQRAGFLARRGIARAILSLVLDVAADEIEIGAGEAGQPLLRAPSGSYHLSFSARGKLALIGISTRPIGVDLEVVEPDLLIPWNVLRADERGLLEALPESGRARAFCALWTAKEAVVKALGLGFRMPPEAIHIAGWAAPGHPMTIAGLDARPGSLGARPSRWHLKTCDNLVVAELTGGLVVGAACIASSSGEPGTCDALEIAE